MMNGWQFARSAAADCAHFPMNSVTVIAEDYHTSRTLKRSQPSPGSRRNGVEWG
jgi:hypothetical protein